MSEKLKSIRRGTDFVRVPASIAAKLVAEGGWNYTTKLSHRRRLDGKVRRVDASR